MRIAVTADVHLNEKYPERFSALTNVISQVKNENITCTKFLMKDCGLSDEQMAEIFNKGCNLDIPDLVIIKAYVKKGDLLWNKEILVNSIKDEFSAMQRATSGPISVVASLMAEGMFDARYDEHRDYKIRLPLVLSYKDVPYEEFNKRLTILGIL